MKTRFGIIKYVLLALLVAASVTAYAYAYIVRCALIDYSGFTQISGNLYVSYKLPQGSHQEIEALLRDARSRITGHYGTPRANPVIVVVSDQQEANDYGIYDAPGKLFFTPWNNYLVLNYKRKSVDVAAHELVHAEIVDRLGYFRRQYSIPVWFVTNVNYFFR